MCLCSKVVCASPQGGDYYADAQLVMSQNDAIGGEGDHSRQSRTGTIAEPSTMAKSVSHNPPEVDHSATCAQATCMR